MTDRPSNRPTSRPPSISLGKAKHGVLAALRPCVDDVRPGPYSIARRLNKSRSTVRQHLQELAEQGLCKKESYAWQLTQAGKDYLDGRYGVALSERGVGGTRPEWYEYDRAHNLKVKVEVINAPPVESWLSSWRPVKLKNNVFYMSRFGEVVTTFTGKHLIFQLPVLSFRDSASAVAMAGRLGLGLIRKYELEVSGLRLGTPEVSAQLISQSHAVPFEPFAKWCHANGISVRDPLVEIDASNRTPELEFVNNSKSHVHHENYVDFVKDVIVHDNLLRASELHKLIQDALQIQVSTNAQLQNVVLGLSAAVKVLQVKEKGKVLSEQPESSVHVPDVVKDWRPDYVG